MEPEKKIVIFDDDDDRREEWEQILADRVEPERIQRLGTSDFLDIVAQLDKRHRHARECGAHGEVDFAGLECDLDEVGILLVDYDLLELEEGKAGSFITGERIAYLARCYSRCDIVVALNQFGQNSFDLTLGGHPESFADLNIGSDQLGSEGLWSRYPWEGFRPWQWPLLSSAEDKFHARLEELDDCMDEPVFEVLSIDPENQGSAPFPREVLAFISPQNQVKDASKATVNDMVRSSIGGLDPRDRTSAECERRIAASRLTKWLETFVLSGQSILVDGPHLIERNPNLLVGDRSSPDVWNESAALPSPSSFDEERIERFRFKKSHWLWRDAWHWPSLRDQMSSEDGFWSPGGPDLPDLVFCEDSSRFVSSENATEFVSSVPSPFVRRFIERPDSDVRYWPSARLAY